MNKLAQTVSFTSGPEPTPTPEWVMFLEQLDIFFKTRQELFVLIPVFVILIVFAFVQRKK